MFRVIHYMDGLGTAVYAHPTQKFRLLRVDHYMDHIMPHRGERLNPRLMTDLSVD